MESESKAANWHAMNRHFPCSAMMDAVWNSTQHHCLRGDSDTRGKLYPFRCEIGICCLSPEDGADEF